jgi:hypothetical protein
VTIGVVAALLAFDLWLASVRPHAVGYREAAAGQRFTSRWRWCSAGPPLLDGSDMAAIPGSASARMVGAWPALRTGLTAEVRLSR